MDDAYKQSGVNIEAGNEVVRRIKGAVRGTHSNAVLADIGSFGALYDLKAMCGAYTHPILVQSIDGVGTKLAVAQMMHKYDTVGEDIVNHSCNDIVAMGARPLTFLDYVAHDKLDPDVMEAMVLGMARACKSAGVSLIGGETAEMPGIYMEGQHDIAGCITGIVEKEKIITGEKIAEGDIILGLSSSGLHTNGYSLARKLFFEAGQYTVESKFPGLEKTLGETLLVPHTNYTPAILALMDAGIDIHGLAHITGGGFLENIPRVLPESCDAAIRKGSWPVLPIFTLMETLGKITETEMYRVFNMGIGMTVIIAPDMRDRAEKILAEYSHFKTYHVGDIIKGDGKVILQ